MGELKAVLWDFDGTLFDTEPLWAQIEEGYASDMGGTLPSNFTDYTTGGSVLNTATVLSRYIPNPPPAQDAANEIVRRVAEHFASMELPWRPGAAELLSQVHAAGIPQALVTASWKPVLAAVLNRLDKHPFGVIVSGEELCKPKPAPDPYLEGARRLGIDPSDCLVIEDSTHGCAAGNAAGCIVLAVPSVQVPPPAPRRILRDSLFGLDVDQLAAIFSEGDQS